MQQHLHKSNILFVTDAPVDSKQASKLEFIWQLSNVREYGARHHGQVDITLEEAFGRAVTLNIGFDMGVPFSSLFSSLWPTD